MVVALDGGRARWEAKQTRQTPQERYAARLSHALAQAKLLCIYAIGENGEEV